MNDVVVRIDGLHKSFGHLEVVKGVDLEVHKGEVVVIFGRSGSGKSTVLRCVNFIEDPTEGSIEVAGIRLAGGHRTRSKREQVRRLTEDPSAIEEIARRELGLIRPGERVFIIKDLPPAKP